jgi:hypothetical protein
MSEAADFITQILSFLACGDSSVVKTLNYSSFDMRRMVRFEVEVSSSVSGFSVNISGQYHSFLGDQNIQKRSRTDCYY